jgi:hypothetical protein
MIVAAWAKGCCLGATEGHNRSADEALTRRRRYSLRHSRGIAHREAREELTDPPANRRFFSGRDPQRSDAPFVTLFEFDIPSTGRAEIIFWPSVPTVSSPTAHEIG